MKLAEICKELTYTCLQGEMEKEISDIIYDSRKVEKDTVFVCMVGAVVDGHDFVEDAVKKGAAALVVEHAVETDIPENCTVLQVEDARYALAIMSAAFFGHPDRVLTTIGLTGTKGKTTTTYMIKSVLEEAGKKVGLIGTIGALIGEEKLPAKNTTPESYELHKMFRAMVDAGCEYVVMEVSSQGLKMHRVAGIVFDYGIFTNLSPDHIGPNEHASFEEYQECKSLLFRQCKEGIVNADDEHVEGIIKNHTCKLHTFSCKKDADLMAGAVGYLDEEGQIDFHFDQPNCTNEDYVKFMRKTGLFDLMENHIVNNLVDYVTGIETGLDSNGRKNRGGHLMENLVESFLRKAGFVKGENYFKEMYIHEIEAKWGIDLSSISNNGGAEKRFDFVVKGENTIYGIETNFYTSSGSKLNETARSYKTITMETKDLGYFKFVWFTDGCGWRSAKNNLKETFDVLEHLYNIADLENGIISKVLV